MRHLLTLLLTLATISASAQTRKICELIIDPEYKGIVEVFNKPIGKIIRTLKQDFKNEDFLTFSVVSETSDFFYGTLKYSISEKQTTGWIKKAKNIGLYARNYESGVPLKLFSEPKASSKVASVVPDWTNELYQVTSTKNGWVYAKVRYRGQWKQGWLSPDMQCADPYTMCN